MNDQFKKFKGYDKEIMIFLYRDVGMLWEKHFKKRSMCIYKEKREIKTIFHQK